MHKTRTNRSASILACLIISSKYSFAFLLIFSSLSPPPLLPSSSSPPPLLPSSPSSPPPLHLFPPLLASPSPPFHLLIIFQETYPKKIVIDHFAKMGELEEYILPSSPPPLLFHVFGNLYYSICVIYIVLLLLKHLYIYIYFYMYLIYNFKILVVVFGKNLGQVLAYFLGHLTLTQPCVNSAALSCEVLLPSLLIIHSPLISSPFTSSFKAQLPSLHKGRRLM